MKKISIIIPTFNEEENIQELYTQLSELLVAELSKYQYEIIFIDNNSIDKTQTIIKNICKKDKNVKAILNVRNFGPFNSPYYGLLQGIGNCSILLCADFQDPLEMIPKFVKEWENGYDIVCAIKSTSKENKLMYYVRSLYYKIIKKISDVEQIENFTGFALYDEKFIEILKSIKEPIPFLRGLVAEYGFNRKDIEYTQQKRRAGKTSFNLYRLYDAAMISFTSYTVVGLRIATFFGFFMSVVSLIIALIYLVYKIIYWDRFIAGTTPLIVGIFVIGSAQLFFIGLLGEYIISINKRIMNRPLVIENERINFDD